MGRKHIVHKSWKPNESSATFYNQAYRGFAEDYKRKNHACNNPNLSRLSDGKRNHGKLQVFL
jgi:hypothetical protein